MKLLEHFVTPKPVLSGITLNLTLEEARTLATIAGKCAGSAIYSRRKHTDILFQALKDAGVSYNSTIASGCISFKEEAGI